MNKAAQPAVIALIERADIEFGSLIVTQTLGAAACMATQRTRADEFFAIKPARPLCAWLRAEYAA